MSATEKLVTINRLKALLDAYGASPERWPDEERAAATALIETSAAARRLVEEAATLDSLLDKVPEPEVSAALASRVRSAGFAAADRRNGSLFARLAEYLRPRTALAWQGAVAMAGILGMVAGVGMSALVLDHGGQAPRAVAEARPAAVETVNVASNVNEASQTETNSASLAPDLTSFSLTGEDTAASQSDAVVDTQSDDGEMTVAAIPLY